MAEHRLEITINLRGITNQLQIQLQHAMNLVAVGLHHAPTLADAPPQLPDTTLGYNFAANERWTPEQTRDEWTRWILTNGFRDVSEAIAATLEEVQTVLAHWELESLQSRGLPLKVADWNDIAGARGRRFHRLGLPDKLRFLERTYGFVPDTDLSRCGLSINAVRNCLVHRQGIVQPQDITTKDQLLLEWRALTIVATNEAGEREIGPGAMVEAGTQIGVANRPRSKGFPLGSRIVLTSDEFAQVCWTILLLGQVVTNQLEKHGRSLGITFRQPEGAT